MSRIEAEAILRDATGGDQPEINSMLRFGLYGWQFVPDRFLGIVETIPDNPPDGTFWFELSSMRMGAKLNGRLFRSEVWEEVQ